MAALLTVAVLLALGVRTQGQFVFTRLSEDTTLNEGDTLELFCEAVFTEIPAATLNYTWDRNGTVLSNTSTLTIPSVSPSASGRYTCAVSMGGLSDSRTVQVTVTHLQGGLSGELVAVIAVSVVMGVIVMVIIALLLFVWWWCRDSAPDTPKRLGKRRKSEVSNDQELGGLSANKRSRSLGHLLQPSRKNSTFEDPYDRNLSRSTEQLLSGEENTVHPPTVDNIDFGPLNLDERLFEAHKKAVSDTNLKDGVVASIHSQIKPLPIDDLSKHHRMHSDPYIKPSLSHRNSLTSSASDLGDEISDSQSQASSTMKSVRFDFNDSGVATETSSPLHPRERRRYSAPDVKYVRETPPRRGSAPDELIREGQSTDVQLQGDGRPTDEGSGSDHQLELCPDNKVVSIVSLLSSSQPDPTSPRERANPLSTGRVSEIREKFQKGTRGHSEPEPQFRTKSISKLVTETTRQLMQSKSESSVSPSKSPGKLAGLTKQPTTLSNLATKASPDADTHIRPTKAAADKVLTTNPAAPNIESSHKQEEPWYSGTQDSIGDAFDTEFEQFERGRMSALGIPFFGAPVSSLPWQRKNTDLMDSDSDSDEDDGAMLMAPLKPSSGIANISPFGKGMVGRGLLGLPQESPNRGLGSEIFVRTTPSRTPSRKSSVGRLSSIPEESPQSSAISLTGSKTL